MTNPFDNEEIEWVPFSPAAHHIAEMMNEDGVTSAEAKAIVDAIFEDIERSLTDGLFYSDKIKQDVE